MSIKLQYLCLAQRKYPDQAPSVDECTEEEINTWPLEADRNRETSDFTPFPFSTEEAWIRTQARRSFGA